MKTKQISSIELKNVVKAEVKKVLAADLHVKVVDQDDFYDEYVKYLNNIDKSVNEFIKAMSYVEVENGLPEDLAKKDLIAKLEDTQKEVGKIANAIFVMLSKKFPE